MKPPLALLTSAPVLVLGLEGPAHSFVRFKSYPVVAKSAALLWKLTGHTHDGLVTERVAVPPGTVVGEYGVLASSSSRYARVYICVLSSWGIVMTRIDVVCTGSLKTCTGIASTLSTAPARRLNSPRA
jgi:hypothetical protein